MSTTGHPTTAIPTTVVAPRASSNGLHARLLRATASNSDGDTVRAELRRVVKDAVGATCVAHLICDAQGQFSLENCRSAGEMPTAEDSARQFSSLASLAIGRGATQVKSLADDSQLICSPVSVPGSTGEVLAALIPAGLANLQATLFALELATHYQLFWARGNVAVANQWKLNSLAAIIELVSNVEQQSSVAAAANVLANDAAKFLGCDRVAIAIADGEDLQLHAISDLKSFDQNSEVVMLMRETLIESRLQDDLCLWPLENNKTPGLLAHKTLVRQLHLKSVLTIPLKSVDGETIGAWLFAGGGDVVSSERVGNFVRAASPRVATAIQLVQLSSRGIVARTNQKVADLIRDRKGKILLAMAVLLLGILMLPMPYRVRCQCVIEPVARRFAVAPFDGMVEEAVVEAGDIVNAGTLLAKMDGRELRWELSAAQAKRGQVQKQREIELTNRNVPEVLISQLEAEELTAKIDTLRYRTSNLEVTAPVDGVVLSSSLEKGQSAPVGTGDVLYEIGPLEQLRVEIEVPANEVAQIAAGQQVKIWIDGFESDPIVAEIQELRPRSELRQDRNVFIAKVAIDNRDQTLRPGMRGSARITGPRRPLVWNLFHKPWEYATSRLTWW